METSSVKQKSGQKLVKCFRTPFFGYHKNSRIFDASYAPVDKTIFVTAKKDIWPVLCDHYSTKTHGRYEVVSALAFHL